MRDFVGRAVRVPHALAVLFDVLVVFQSLGDVPIRFDARALRIDRYYP